MVQLSKYLNKQSWFHHTILAVIVLNAILLGIETFPALASGHEGIFLTLNGLIQIVFVTEILIRLLAYWPKPVGFFHDGWNVFDFVIVSFSLLPIAGPFASVARLARILRVARLISLSNDLKLIVGTMLKSLPSMGHVGLLLGVLLYVYGILGFHLFKELDPAHWGGLGVSVLSLFKILTLEGWIEMQDQVIGGNPWAWVYFMSFIILAVFVVVNLFIAVVINNLETVKKEQQVGGAHPSNEELIAQLSDLRKKLSIFEIRLRREKNDQ